MTINANLENATRIQEKFEFYVVALTFTILGLSIQTATFGVNIFADVSELIGWVLLFISGLFGLWRLEWVPVVIKNYAGISKAQRELQEYEVAQEHGQELVPVEDDERGQIPIQELITIRRQQIKEGEENANKVEKNTTNRYLVHKVTFVFGLLALLLARLAIPVRAIIDSLCALQT